MSPTYLPSWESLQTHPIPDWYLDGKFGIFIHWGLYSVPAFGNEWYPRNMYLEGTPEYEHHRSTYGPHDHFGYKDFIPLFSARQFDPDAWATLFKQSGAHFVVPVAEHHDGFAMYNTRLSDWNAAKKGPKRDIVGELAAAVRGKGMVFGLSSHRAEHWWFMNGGRLFPSDVQDPAFVDFYGPAALASGEEWKSRDWQPRPNAQYLDDWLARCCELVDNYHPQLFWFDWWIEQIVFQPYLQKFAAYYYNRAEEWGSGVAINYKNESFAPGSAVLDIERGQMQAACPFFWQNDTSISKNSWGFVQEQDYKTAQSLIGDLVDVVSKNGALLLNIGPRPDGTIPEPEQQILGEIGAWLAVNGEAIYGSRPWKVFGEGPTEIPEGSFTDTQRQPFTGEDMRFTTKGEIVYAILLAWPGKHAIIHSLSKAAGLLPGPVTQVSLLGSQGSLSWSQEEQALRVDLPEQPPGEYAFVLKIVQG